MLFLFCWIFFISGGGWIFIVCTKTQKFIQVLRGMCMSFFGKCAKFKYFVLQKRTKKSIALKDHHDKSTHHRCSHYIIWYRGQTSILCEVKPRIVILLFSCYQNWNNCRSHPFVLWLCWTSVHGVEFLILAQTIILAQIASKIVFTWGQYSFQYSHQLLLYIFKEEKKNYHHGPDIGSWNQMHPWKSLGDEGAYLGRKSVWNKRGQGIALTDIIKENPNISTLRKRL